MKIAIDVDDVLGLFTPHAHDFHDITMEKCDYWCVQTMRERLGEGWFIDHIAKDKEFWTTLPVLNGPEKLDFEFECYMSSFPEEMYDQRQQWLKQHGYPDKPLIQTHDKVKSCLELGIDLLIDDKAETIKKVREAGILGLHYMPYYAGFASEGDFITDLNQVNEYVNRKRVTI